jgi:hypothetical protein
MSKIINCHVPGDCTYGYAGPVGGGRSSKRNFCKRVKLKAAQFCALSLVILFTGTGFPAKTAPEGGFGALGNGKFDGWRDIASAMAVPFGLFTSCSSPAGGDTPQNVAQTANAGNDQSITLPTDSTALNGSASSDSDGSIAAYEWTQISKPNGAADAVLGSPAEVTTTVSGLTTAGAYTFQLKVTDNDGAENTDTIVVTVNPPQNVAPTANAGSDQTITLPISDTTLNGNASSDSDGSIAAYEWTLLSKPNGAADAVLGSPAEVTTTVSGLTTAGAYTFQLKVTDDDGAESTDTIVVTVNPPQNVAPTASAGSDQSITLPTTSVTLNGGASSDSDGSIVAYEWTQVSGPVTATIVSSASSSTDVNGLTAKGKYTFQLKVTDDDGAESTDAVDVTVKETKTANVTVKANNFSAGDTLNFAPDYEFAGAEAAYFNASDITYTLSSTNPEIDLNSYNGIVPANLYNNNATPTFTQVFYYNGQEVGIRTIVGVVSLTEFIELYEDDTNWTQKYEIPAVNLQQISKDVAE